MNPTLLLALGIGWLISIAGASYVGWDYRDAKVAQENQAIAKAYAEWAEQQQERADGLDTKLSATRSAQAPRDRLITKEITRYVQVTPPDHRCTLPGTWRVRHDAAATGVPIGPDSGPVGIGENGAVEDATALDTVGENYGLARECFDKLDYWQRRYRTIEHTRTAQ